MVGCETTCQVSYSCQGPQRGDPWKCSPKAPKTPFVSPFSDWGHLYFGGRLATTERGQRRKAKKTDSPPSISSPPLAPRRVPAAGELAGGLGGPALLRGGGGRLPGGFGAAGGRGQPPRLRGVQGAERGARGESQNQTGKVSRGKTQPELLAAAFAVLRIGLGTPFSYQDLIVTQVALVGSLVSQRASYVVGRLLGDFRWLLCWFVGWLLGWLVGWLDSVGRSVGWLAA